MPKKPIETKEDTDRQDHIRDLQRRAEEFVSGELAFFESEEMSQDLREQFWERVVAFEETEWITSFELLVQGGMELPAPEELDDSQLEIRPSGKIAVSNLDDCLGDSQFSTTYQALPYNWLFI